MLNQNIASIIILETKEKSKQGGDRRKERGNQQTDSNHLLKRVFLYLFAEEKHHRQENKESYGEMKHEGM